MASQGPPSALPRTLGFLDLLLLSIVAVINVSLLPPLAGFGRAALALWVVAFLLFFVPEAIAVVTFSRRFPGEGGIYLWARRVFGDTHGFVSGWSYWLGNLFYFPMQLVYLAGVLAYAGGAGSAGLVDCKWFVAAVSFGWLALAVGGNMLGLAVGKWFPNIGALGSMASVAVIVVAGAAAGGSGTAETVPVVAGSTGDLVSSLGVMCFAFIGIELASLMGDEMRNGRRDLPRAVVIAGLLVLAAYVAGTAALQALVPTSEIGTIQGVLQAVAHGASRFGAEWMTAPLAAALAIAISGGLSAWFAGAARIPFVAGFDHALPAWLGRVHPRWGSPYLALGLQGGLAALLISATLVGSTVAEAYQVLLKSSVITTLIPFAYMFAGLTRLDGAGPAVRIAGAVGLTVSVLGAFAAFVPGRDVTSVAVFEAKLVAGVVAPIGVGLWLFGRARRQAAAVAAVEQTT